MNEPKELNYPLTEAKAEIVDGERKQEAIVNQEPKENVVNTITVDEVKDIAKEDSTPVIPENVAKIHNFAEGTILTDEILEQVKSGDIVKMANMEFVVNNKVNQTPRSITGKMVGATNVNSVEILILDWDKDESLSPTSIVFNQPYLKSVSQIGSATQLAIAGISPNKTASVSFELTSTEEERLNNAKYVVFTMNGTFCTTPLSQSGDTLGLNSFAYNDLGNTRSVRYRFTKTNNGIEIRFDTDFAEACDFNTPPYALLLIAE